jgi:hypothetical protein
MQLKVIPMQCGAQTPTSQFIVAFGGGGAQHVPPQSGWPLLHVGEHILLMQCRVPPETAGHAALVHAPQWSGSLDVSTHAPPQFVSAAPQQTPLLHVVPPGHACPHVPQFWLSAW